MAYDGVYLHSLVKELKEKLIHGRIDKLFQPEQDELNIQIKTKTVNAQLKLSADASVPYISIDNTKKVNPASPPMFCMLLRKHIVPGRIVDITQPGLERIVNIEIESRDELGDLTTKILCIEIMGKHSNIILYNKSDKRIIDSAKRIPLSMSRVRQVLPGAVYELPPMDKASILEDDFLGKLDFSKENHTLDRLLLSTYQGFSKAFVSYIIDKYKLDFNDDTTAFSSEDEEKIANALSEIRASIINDEFKWFILSEKKGTFTKPLDIHSFKPALEYTDPYFLTEYDFATECVNDFYLKRDVSNRFSQKAHDVKKSIDVRLERAYKKLDNLNKDLKATEKADNFKSRGELILANIYQLQKGDSELKAIDYYAEEPAEVIIKLDTRLTPSENAQKLFKRYNKLKTGKVEIAKQLAETKSDIEYLENSLALLVNSTDLENIDEIRNELAEQGYLKKRATKGKKKKQKPSKPHHFVSTEGFDIFVGKNNIQNDELTLKTASNKDLWLHTKIIPGSHVIIKTNGKEVPENTIYEAAMLAAFYSKARTSGQVPVDYTIVKNVSKPSGSKPGLVIYVSNKTMYVTPDEKFIKTLEAPK